MAQKKPGARSTRTEDAHIRTFPIADTRLPGRDRIAIERIASIGLQPDDPEDVRIAKRVVTLTAGLITTLSTVWVVTYFALALPLSAAIPLTYQVVTIVSLIVFARTKRLAFLRETQLAMMLLLPFLLQLSLGGFAPSSGVVLWSFTAPVGALMIGGVRSSLAWFVAFAVVVVLSGVLDPLIAPAEVPTGIRIAFAVMNVLGVSATAFLLLRYFVLEREKERAKSERLLLNVLPAPIAARLRDAESTIADRVEDVTVLFADLVGFTQLSASADAHDVVDLLNGLFSRFDELAERHGLEKIKTIGDAYMVAGGLPTPRPDHAEAIADMALEMIHELEGRRAGPGPPLELRIGIDTGPVVAGVIGIRRFIYDVWGDTVNTASRMESHGVPGKIQVTERTYAVLRDRYAFVERGTIDVKGRGPMRTWFLEGRLGG
jgi:class 3 adenylate cyclase